MIESKDARLSKIFRQSRLKSPYDKWPFAKRLYIYQKERVPLIVLALMNFLLMFAVLKAYGSIDWYRLVLVILASTAYFFQIKLADEIKDYENDNHYHKDRPVQRGLISLKEISDTKNACVIIFLILAAMTGSLTVFGLAIVQQFYSYLTRKEFFIRDWLRERFIIYQLLHYIQLPLLGWTLVNMLGISPLANLVYYLGFVVIMTLQLEIARSIGGNDGHKEAKDRWSYIIGSQAALITLLVLNGIAIYYTIDVVIRNGLNLNPLLLALGLIIIGMVSLIYIHDSSTKNGEKMMPATIALYLCATMTIIVG